MPAVVMFRRAVFEFVGGFETFMNPSADYDMYLRIARRFPVHHHGEVVAEHRRHGANMTRDLALMLGASVSVLRSQRKHVKGHEQYEEAYKAGIRFEQRHSGNRLVDGVRAHVKEREWKRALRGVLALLRYYLRGIALVNERRRLARRLRRRKQDLEAHERRLKELDKRSGVGERLGAKGGPPGGPTAKKACPAVGATDARSGPAGTDRPER